jgi:hypothetical protein
MNSAVSLIGAVLGILVPIIGVVVAFIKNEAIRSRLEQALMFLPLYCKDDAIKNSKAVLANSTNTDGIEKVVDYDLITCAVAIEEAPPLAATLKHLNGHGRKLHAHRVVLEILGMVMVLFFLLNLIYVAVVTILFSAELGDPETLASTMKILALFSFVPTFLAIGIGVFVFHMWIRNLSYSKYHKILKQFGRIQCDNQGGRRIPAHLIHYMDE